MVDYCHSTTLQWEKRLVQHCSKQETKRNSEIFSMGQSRFTYVKSIFLGDANIQSRNLRLWSNLAIWVRLIRTPSILMILFCRICMWSHQGGSSGSNRNPQLGKNSLKHKSNILLKFHRYFFLGPQIWLPGKLQPMLAIGGEPSPPNDGYHKKPPLAGILSSWHFRVPENVLQVAENSGDSWTKVWVGAWGTSSWSHTDEGCKPEASWRPSTGGRRVSIDTHQRLIGVL
jgi:hypothetical protein